MTGAPEPDVLAVRRVTVSYRAARGARRIALRDVTLSLAAGETLGIVGESGSGKSTLARTVLGLERPDRGEVRVCGADLATLGGRALRRRRRDIGMVFQDPRAALDPRMAVGALVAEPLMVHGIGDRAARDARVRTLLDRVGLGADAAARLPHELSGGQRQRVAIARALAAGPRLLVADEPVAALDPSVQAQILNLFADIRREFGLTTLFISHDLAVVRHVSDRVAVLLGGAVVEEGRADAVFAAPAHPYTRKLLDAVPKL